MDFIGPFWGNYTAIVGLHFHLEQENVAFSNSLIWTRRETKLTCFMRFNLFAKKFEKHLCPLRYQMSVFNKHLLAPYENVPNRAKSQIHLIPLGVPVDEPVYVSYWDGEFSFIERKLVCVISCCQFCNGPDVYAIHRWPSQPDSK